jgi:hypothetical protein
MSNLVQLAGAVGEVLRRYNARHVTCLQSAPPPAPYPHAERMGSTEGSLRLGARVSVSTTPILIDGPSDDLYGTTRSWRDQLSRRCNAQRPGDGKPWSMVGR